MQIHVFSSAGPDAGAVIRSQISALGTRPALVALHGNVESEAGPLLRDLKARACPTLRASSCQGAMSDAGPTAGQVAFVIVDPAGSYGAACRGFDLGAGEAGRQATIAALAQAARPGEKPDLVWMSSTPGAEEAVLHGVASVVGTDVPIIGGSAADNDVGGAWFVGDAASQCPDGVAVAVLFPSTTVSYAYQNGYAPTGQRGRVTRASGRLLHEINGRPAAEVYQAWTGGAVAAPAHGTQPILAEATLWPLGREITHLGRVPYHLLAHPAAADASGALHLFADISEGETLCQMEGSIDGLATRAGRVVALARRAGGFAADQVAGAFVIYCGGCMMTLGERIGEVTTSIRTDLGAAPFAGTFTFGEQGPIVGSGNRHGNLMISCILFGK
ncbi:MAG: FIST C-terminal domain-containing protein [Pseudomonadota bacterium]